MRKRVQSILGIHRKETRSLYVDETAFYPEGWGRPQIGYFNRESKAWMFRSIMTFFSTNAVEGDYFEFGCYGAFTMRIAFDHLMRLRKDTIYHAFDSFAGFPDLTEEDDGHWKAGDLCMDEATFRNLCRQHGMPNECLETYEGYFSDTLNSGLQAKLAAKKAAIIYVDVDLYSSAKSVLEFIPFLLSRGSVIVFDDWNCFYADPESGERRAFSEFQAANPGLRFEPLFATHMAQAFVFLGSDR